MSANNSASEVYPAPHFEGSEKRVELDFDAASEAGSLRAIPRSDLDAMLRLAACEIVSLRQNDEFDAYVLSESSLFIYPTKMVLKTCGTTRLLNAVPRMIELAAARGLEVVRCKYSRASFLFPDNQPAIYQNWDDEVAFLDAQFAAFPHGAHTYVMGDAAHGLQWHVYVADVEGEAPPHRQHSIPFKLEICMTELDEAKAAQFYRTADFVSAPATTEATGIRSVFPRATIDDYVFEPCGYSMNGLEGGTFSTIHVTPEPECSYASLEVCSLGASPAEHFRPSHVVRRAAEIFGPGRMTVAISVPCGRLAAQLAWCGRQLHAPRGYEMDLLHIEDLGAGGRVAFVHLTAEGRAAERPRGSHGVEAAAADADTGASSPVSDGDERMPHISEAWVHRIKADGYLVERSSTPVFVPVGSGQDAQDAQR
ncbi:unnamed protein product [Pedinophyceae sp. YPF-701]|nr:unnamed protein product [Pedinophyceae sp. YPF-701]